MNLLGLFVVGLNASASAGQGETFKNLEITKQRTSYSDANKLLACRPRNNGKISLTNRYLIRSDQGIRGRLELTTERSLEDLRKDVLNAVPQAHFVNQTKNHISIILHHIAQLCGIAHSS
ncbi:hypothetical protein PoB_001110000 [Plakobranchus ocellatus]|uniref:Uncharacterized protein n=1 Tax=Plakobranchus ocellatus TaxID=259542 RepID=A0AAV3YQ70_9GAST|nr:hypothetical protein PoB_001110000 [Plakobranchus ocellatus]